MQKLVLNNQSTRPISPPLKGFSFNQIVKSVDLLVTDLNIFQLFTFVQQIGAVMEGQELAGKAEKDLKMVVVFGFRISRRDTTRVNRCRWISC